MSTKFSAASEALQGAGFDSGTADSLLAQLVMLQHHLDDAEVYSAQGRTDAVQGSLDDAEENTEAVAEQVLPPAKAEVVEGVQEQGEDEEREAGVDDDDAKEARANDAFEIGLRYTFHKQGFDASRIEALVDVAKGMASGSVKTAADIHGVMVPHVLAEQYVKTSALAAPVIGGAIGAGIGAFREKDPGEGRLFAILRSALTGGATGLGAGVGSLAGGIAGLLGGPAAGVTVPLGAAFGGGSGGALAFQLAKRKGAKKDASRESDEKSDNEPSNEPSNEPKK